MGNANQMMPERRRGTRIFTLRNAAVAGAVILVVFMAVSVVSEMRSSTSGRFGRLYGKELAKNPAPPAEPAAARGEAPAVSEETYADPTLLNAAVRQQYLGADEPAVAIAPPALSAPTPPVSTASATSSADLTITGGADGLNVESRERSEPVLSGGFGKPAQP